MKYKVIWFDDEHQERMKIRESAHINDIQLVGYSNAEEGIAELEKCIEAYDAAILDGIFYEIASEKGKPTEDNAMGKVAKKLLALQHRKKLPWFILSGQSSFTKEKNRFAEAFKNGKVYDKLGGAEEYERLWKTMMAEADILPETQARRNNPKLFEIFELGYLPDAVEHQLLQLLISDLPSNQNDLKGMLSNIRSIHESCLIRLENIRVIPDANDKFATINKHLSGNKRWDSNLYKMVATTHEFQNSTMENLNAWIYFTCGTYIHNLKNQHYGGYMISNYAIESLRSGLFEILLWFKKTVEENK